ncbi:hypothetical protein [Lentilactobacillus sp. Marseille-Q4993]|uniref:hypothetical protein n=1 Tax=Lentilactobacillus sp. Marseille-Q4993 TaxID=3039492 RepID=UPI0024BC3947|nr:hypothetical protein [Lentilactobacillus sp. Marseille-Q4993]
MTAKNKWITIGILTYIIFILVVIVTNILDPARIGAPWTVFWYVAAVLIIYYLCFKNYVYERVIYYARALDLTQTDLQDMLVVKKSSQVAPNPARKFSISPLFNLSLQNLDRIDEQLRKLAKTKEVKPFR